MITHSMQFFFCHNHFLNTDMVSKCDLCNKTFKRSGEIEIHVRSVHENQRHECGICHTLFTRQITCQVNY